MAGKLGRLTGRSSDHWLRGPFPRAGASRGRLAGDRARPLGVGMLVNHQIMRAVKESIIEVNPLDENNVRPASIDLTLDDFILTSAGDRIDITDGHIFSSCEAAAPLMSAPGNGSRCRATTLAAPAP